MVHSLGDKRLEQPLKERQAGTSQLHRHPGTAPPPARSHPRCPSHCPAGSSEGPSRPAMLILSCSSKLRLLEGMLRQGLPDTLPVYGTVMHVNRGNLAGQEVLVDSWPEFKIVLTRPNREVAWDPSDFGTNLYTAFYRDEGACRALLGNSRAVDWGQAFQIQGLQDGVYETIRDIARARGLEMEMYPYRPLLHPDPPAMPQYRPDKGLRLAPVSPAHAMLLSDAWMFGGNSWSLRYLCLLIRHFPNACLLAPEGPPISWSLTDPLAALMHGYTLPEHRGQRHIGSVVGILAAQLHARGFPVYTRVLPHNEPSLHHLQGLGFRILPGVFYQLVVRPGFAQSLPASALDLAQDAAPSSGGRPCSDSP
ncbi:glycine N-acyltransferase-like protein 3 [Dermochelys coriacea]|uniref:glycine N-acyltransferase-like protein 3 n=1 Tax=Dermochelys coriacea TaxID=27794 RepID=UPI001CA9B32F|nr:glycine N-acyltransferase-like protein 3 [Dermochelys coriacea]